jgi:lysophospholipase L1-like esterase
MLTRPAVEEGADVPAGRRLGTVLGGGQVTMSVTVNGQATPFGSWLQSTASETTIGQGSVFIVGDSLTVGMSGTRPAWERTAFPELKVSVEAAVSRATARGDFTYRGTRYAHGISVLESNPSAQAASTWIVALGSNDLTGSAASSDVYVEKIREVMTLAQDRSVVWVNVHRAKFHDPRLDPVNVALRQAQTRYASLSVLDWAAAVSGNEDEYLTDGLHLTPRGVDRRVELIQRANTSAAGVSETSIECATSTFGYVLPAGPMAQAAVQWALGRAEANARYVAGAGRDADPFGMEYDCSSFTYAAYKIAGLNWNMKLSYQQFEYSDFVVEVPAGQEQPGDLIFQDWKRDGLDLPRGYSGRGGIDHVGLVVDPSAQTMVHAANPSSGVTVGNYNFSDTRTVGFARVIDPSMTDQAGSGAVFLAPVAERVGAVNRYGRSKRSVLQYPVVERILREASQYKDVRRFAGNSANGNQRMDQWMKWNPAIEERTNRSVAAVMMVREFGYPVSEWACLDRLWWHESGWGSSVRDPNRAGGIPQAFPATKMLNADAGGGQDAFDNPVTQIRWGLSYIKNRYSNPCGAWEAWRTNSATGEHGYGWY